MSDDLTYDDALVPAVREALAAHGGLSGDAATLAPTDDLYAAGLTSHASVTVMLALEDAFDLEFEAKHLNRATFSSIAMIASTLTDLGAEPDGAPGGTA